MFGLIWGKKLLCFSIFSNDMHSQKVDDKKIIHIRNMNLVLSLSSSILTNVKSGLSN